MDTTFITSTPDEKDEMVWEILDTNSTLTWLTAQEEFTA
jgi:hypothetical protein